MAKKKRSPNKQQKTSKPIVKTVEKTKVETKVETVKKEKPKKKTSSSTKVFTSHDFSKVTLEIPVKCNMFGGLTRKSKLYVFEVLRNNKEWLLDNWTFNKCNNDNLYEDGLLGFIKRINMKHDMVSHIDDYTEKTHYLGYNLTNYHAKPILVLRINLMKAYIIYARAKFIKKGILPVYIEFNPFYSTSLSKKKYGFNAITISDGKNFYKPSVSDKSRTLYRLYMNDKEEFDICKENNLRDIEHMFKSVSLKAIRV